MRGREPPDSGTAPGWHPDADPSNNQTNQHHRSYSPASSLPAQRSVSSQVRWWDFHEWVQPYLDAARDWPMVGSQAWFDLPDGDPRKWAAVLSAAEHWALRVETCQEARCEASHDVSAAENWFDIAQQIRQRRAVYIRRRAS